eukprot:scaffold27727_cov102-Isochrysis_galbana.AAC.1
MSIKLVYTDCRRGTWARPWTHDVHRRLCPRPRTTDTEPARANMHVPCPGQQLVPSRAARSRHRYGSPRLQRIVCITSRSAIPGRPSNSPAEMIGGP